MSNTALCRASWIAGLLLAAVGSTAQAQSADELLAQASNLPPPRGAAKPDGARFTTSAARYADVKRDVQVPRAVAKRDDRRRFADPALPDWLRLSSIAAEEESLRDVPEVGLLGVKSRKELQSIVDGILKNQQYVEDDYPKALDVEFNFRGRRAAVSDGSGLEA